MCEAERSGGQRCRSGRPSFGSAVTHRNDEVRHVSIAGNDLSDGRGKRKAVREGWRARAATATALSTKASPAPHCRRQHAPLAKGQRLTQWQGRWRTGAERAVIKGKQTRVKARRDGAKNLAPKFRQWRYCRAFLSFSSDHSGQRGDGARAASAEQRPWGHACALLHTERAESGRTDGWLLCLSAQRLSLSLSPPLCCRSSFQRQSTLALMSRRIRSAVSDRFPALSSPHSSLSLSPTACVFSPSLVSFVPAPSLPSYLQSGDGLLVAHNVPELHRPVLFHPRLLKHAVLGRRRCCCFALGHLSFSLSLSLSHCCPGVQWLLRCSGEPGGGAVAGRSQSQEGLQGETTVASRS